MAPLGDAAEAVLGEVRRAALGDLAGLAGAEGDGGVVAPDGGQERGEGFGQWALDGVLGHRDALGGGELLGGGGGRGVVGEVGGDELEDVLAVAQILQAVLAEIAEGDVLGQVVADHLLGGEGEEDLAAVAGGHEAGGAVEGGAEVVAAAGVGRAGVDAHAHPQIGEIGIERAPILGGEGYLGVECGGEGVVGVGEGGAKRIAHRLEHMPAVGLDCRAQDLVVADEGCRHGLALLLPALGGAFDVGEQEGEGAGGEGVHDLSAFGGDRRSSMAPLPH